MKEIKINNGIVQVDDEDYDFLTHVYELFRSGDDEHVYVRMKKQYRHKKMGFFSSMAIHKLLMNPDQKGKTIHVDHIDNNPLNNQKSNLRICTHAENMRNRRKLKEGTSQYKGIGWKKDIHVWQAHISIDAKFILLGNFTNEIAAANCYNYHARKNYGEFANLNDIPFMSKEEWMSYKRKKYKSSKYIGVCYLKSINKWVAQIWDGKIKKNIKVGEFDTELEAALAYNRKATKLKGDRAKLNLIN